MVCNHHPGEVLVRETRQVLEAEPECAIVSEDPKPEVYGVDEPISEDEAEDDGRIGYEDIGGLGKVSSI